MYRWVLVLAAASGCSFAREIVPEAALDDAAPPRDTPAIDAPAPVRRPLVGDPQVRASEDTVVSRVAYAFAFTASSTGTADRLALYVDRFNFAPMIEVGLYASNPSSPSTPLATGTITDASGPAWVFVDIPPTPIQVGVRYWIAVLSPLGTIAIRVEGPPGGHSQVDMREGSLAMLPSPWKPGTQYFARSLSAYAEGLSP